MSDEDLGRAAPTPATTEPPPASSFERFLPVTAVAVMIGAFLTMTPFPAMSVIAAAWLIGTRLSRHRRLLGLSLTEALAWTATIAVVEFLAIVLLYLLSNLAAG